MAGFAQGQPSLEHKERRSHESANSEEVMTLTVLVVLAAFGGVVSADGGREAGDNCGWSTDSGGTSYQSVYEERTRDNAERSGDNMGCTTLVTAGGM